ncbi:MAG TPA: hypothetical protein VFE62_25360 [Gemmataceae bacterium]|nr:hypothetical protein [Gemmataceae bacterium]
MERIITQQTPRTVLIQDAPERPTPRRALSEWLVGDVLAGALTVMLAAIGILFLLMTLQPIFTVILAIVVLPVAVPLLIFLVIWYDLHDRRTDWRKL